MYYRFSGILCHPLWNWVRFGTIKYETVWQHRSRFLVRLFHGTEYDVAVVFLNILLTMKSDRGLCGFFGLYLSYVAGVLKHVEEITFYVLWNDELTYSEYIQKAISSEQCTISCVLFEKIYFKISCGGWTVLLKFETSMTEGKLPPVLTFTCVLLRNSVLSSIPIQ